MHRMTAKGIVVLAAMGAAACSGGRQPVRPAPAPTIVIAAPPPPADTAPRLGEGFDLQGRRANALSGDLLGTAQYDLPVVANEWVRMEVDFLVNQRHAVVAGWLRQADRYDEWVRDVFASYGVPRDMHHLGMVESGYRPTVRSHAGAVGMWQFMPATGRGMGLRIDSLVDERMDPVRATHAAARHLRDLHRQFRGDWPLAAAAYNAGAGRINRGLGRYGVNNFWDLAQQGNLAQETRHYVPRLYAVTIIAKDPARFGYPANSSSRRFAYDSIRVDLATPLTVLAQVGNLPVADLVDLNPHMLRQVAPANYWVWVPEGQGRSLGQAYASSEFRQRGGFGYYRVREGDSVQRLAELAGLSPERIRSLNLSSNIDNLRPGERIRLYADAAGVLNARPEPRIARAEPRGSRSEPRVLGEVARAESKPAESRASESTESSRGERSSSAAAASRTEASAWTGRTHTVQDGESLWAIAQRYEVSVLAMREANDLEGDDIQPGQTLRVPRAATASRTESSSASSQRSAASTGRSTSSGSRASGSSSSASRASSSSAAASTERASGSASSSRASGSSSAASSERAAGSAAASRASGSSSAASERSSGSSSSASRAAGSSSASSDRAEGSSERASGSSSASRAAGSASSSTRGSGAASSGESSRAAGSAASGSASRSSGSASAAAGRASGSSSSERTGSTASGRASGSSASGTSERTGSTAAGSSSSTASGRASGSSTASERTSGSSSSASRASGSSTASERTSGSSSSASRASGSSAASSSSSSSSASSSRASGASSSASSSSSSSSRASGSSSSTETSRASGSTESGRAAGSSSSASASRASGSSSTESGRAAGSSSAASGSRAAGSSSNGSGRASSSAAGSSSSSGSTRASGSSASGSTTRSSGTAASGSAARTSGASSSGSTARASGSAAAGSSTRAAGSAPESASRGTARQHTVENGETLWGIARRYEISVDALRDANGLNADSQIRPGQRLRIPN